MNIGQLMGIHKPDTSIEGGWEMWLQMIQGDRYLVSYRTSSPLFCHDIGIQSDKLEIVAPPWPPCRLRRPRLQSR